MFKGSLETAEQASKRLLTSEDCIKLTLPCRSYREKIAIA